MAGHSHSKNIMHRKGAQDQRKARQFAKLIREITVSAKMGLPDPAANPRLRSAVAEARVMNMPKDTIERAIRKATETGVGEDYVEVRYEGRGPGGVALIIEALTDNRNRTASEVRTAFNKNGGTLGESNTVAFLFNRVGAIRYPVGAATADAVLDSAIEAGADDVVSDEDGHEVTCAPDDLFAVRDALAASFGEPETAKLDWQPTMEVALDAETAAALMKLIDALEDNDDVQTVYGNYAIPDDVLQAL